MVMYGTYQFDENELFKLDLSQHGAQVSPRETKSHWESTEQARVQEYVSAMSIEEQKTLLLKVLEAVKRAKAMFTSRHNPDRSFIAMHMAREGFRVEAHSPSPKSDSRKTARSCLENLSHTFLLCTGHLDTDYKEPLVIEPRFREEFEIAHPTPAYQQLLDSLPAEFVGTRRKLRVIVEAVSSAAAEAFKEQGMALPPWRRTAATLSKWDLDSADVGPTHSGLLPIRTTKQVSDRQPQNVGFPENVRVSVKLQRKGSDSLHTSPAKAKQAAKSPGVSLLARGLADASAFQRMHTRRRSDVPAGDKLKRQQSSEWDFSCLPPITTVRRTSKVQQ